MCSRPKAMLSGVLKRHACCVTSPSLTAVWKRNRQQPLVVRHSADPALSTGLVAPLLRLASRNAPNHVMTNVVLDCCLSLAWIGHAQPETASYNVRTGSRIDCSINHLKLLFFLHGLLLEGGGGLLHISLTRALIWLFIKQGCQEDARDLTSWPLLPQSLHSGS